MSPIEPPIEPIGPSAPDPQKLWQSQTQEFDPMTLAAIHEKARTLQRKVGRRNTIEYVAGVFVVLGFLPAVLHRGSWMMQAGGALIIAATLLVIWELHRRGSARPVPEAGAPLMDFYRAELIRQRDALRSVGVWYLGPFAPGMTLLLAGRWFQSHATRRSLGADHLVIALTGLMVIVVFVGVWLLNQRGARQLQRRIEDL
jgi:hypothetical protein